MKRCLTIAALLVATLMPLSGCMSALAQMQGGGPPHDSDSMFSGLFTKKVVDERATAMVGIVNHTGNYIYSASLSGDEVPGGGGGHVCMGRWRCQYLLHLHSQCMASRHQGVGALEYA